MHRSFMKHGIALYSQYETTPVKRRGGGGGGGGVWGHASPENFRKMVPSGTRFQVLIQHEIPFYLSAK